MKTAQKETLLSEMKRLMKPRKPACLKAGTHETLETLPRVYAHHTSATPKTDTIKAPYTCDKRFKRSMRFLTLTIQKNKRFIKRFNSKRSVSVSGVTE